MPTDVKSLYQIFSTRLQMQKSGLTSPHESAKKITQELVSRLPSYNMDDQVDVIAEQYEAHTFVKYVHLKTNSTIVEGNIIGLNPIVLEPEN